MSSIIGKKEEMSGKRMEGININKITGSEIVPQMLILMKSNVKIYWIAI
jgi:spore coat protein CotF